MADVLVVILNKDNARGLQQCLESLAHQERCRICECFDVLIMDGGSEDGSDEVAKEFSRKYPCVEFRVQRVGGGVGPARIEAIKYALSRGYSAIVWGDSENEYSQDYMRRLISHLKEDCDVVSGKSILECGSLWSKLFYWYHSYHTLFKYVRKRHAPGNNKLVKAGVYRLATYPPTSRSDDFYFSIMTLKKNISICYESNAVVKVGLPSEWRGVIGWQRARVRGLVEGTLLLKYALPPDFLPWLGMLLSPIVFALNTLLFTWLPPPLNYLFGALIVGHALAVAALVVKLTLLGREVCIKSSPLQGILGLLGMYLHSIFTVYYTLKYKLRSSELRTALRRRLEELTRELGVRVGYPGST